MWNQLSVVIFYTPVICTVVNSDTVSVDYAILGDAGYFTALVEVV
jgi:hypothetical protein